ncbi:MAG TPA: LuxR C-terminal-related transcriptional regulator [Cellulomonas sp.]
MEQPVEVLPGADAVDVPGVPDVTLHASVVDTVVAYLRDGSQVNLVGMRASGRSTVLRQVTDRLTAAGHRVLLVNGVRALQDRPLAALAVAGLPVAQTSGQLPALVAAVEAVEAVLGEQPAVLVIDDADDLDPASVGAIVAAHARVRTPVLAVSRPVGQRRSGTSDLTAGLAPGVRVRLDPLGFEDVHALVHATLGGAVDPATLAQIAAVSGGLPGLVTATVAAARRENRLVHRDGIWVARGELWCTALALVAEPYLTQVDGPGLDALTLVSLAPSAPLRTVTGMVDPTTLTTLDDLGLLRVRPGGGEPVVEVFPPLLQQYVVRERSALGAALGRGRLAALGTDGDPAGPTAPPTPVDTPVRGAEQLRRHWSQEVRTRRLAWEQRPAPVSAAALLAALAVTAAPAWEIDEVLERSALLDGPAADRAALAGWAARYRAATTGSVAAALAVLDPVRGTVPGYEPLLRAAEAHVRLMAGTRPDDDLPRPTGTDPGLGTGPAADVGADPAALAALAVARAACAVAAGQPAAALELLDGCDPDRPAGHDLQEPELREEAACLRALALLLAGDVPAGLLAARAGIDRAGAALDPVALHEHAYVAAYALALQGRVAELQELTSAVLSLGVVPVHRPHALAGLLTFAAVAAQWQSRRDFARSVATQATARRGARGPFPFMAADLVELLLHEGAGDPEGADRLWAAARERLDGGFLAAGIALGVRAVERDPRADRAQALALAADGGGSLLLRHLADYARAVAAGEAAGLAEQEGVLGAAGLRQYAVRAAVALSARLLADGRAHEAIEHADAAWGRAGLRGRDLCGLFRPLDRAVRVTPREREVAVLVARGFTPPEIAARMVLSVRTVESHILSACHKVGADGREGLARAAQTWLTCAPS